MAIEEVLRHNHGAAIPTAGHETVLERDYRTIIQSCEWQSSDIMDRDGPVIGYKRQGE